MHSNVIFVSGFTNQSINCHRKLGPGYFGTPTVFFVTGGVVSILYSFSVSPTLQALSVALFNITHVPSSQSSGTSIFISKFSELHSTSVQSSTLSSLLIILYSHFNNAKLSLSVSLTAKSFLNHVLLSLSNPSGEVEVISTSGFSLS